MALILEVTMMLVNRYKNTDNICMKTSVRPILVVGDIMLDQYFKGNVSRISPEAPVPVVNVKNIESTLGGSANVASNISTLNGRVVLAGLIGQDHYATELKRLSKAAHIELRTLETHNPTTTKIRVIGEHQQITRLDFEERQVLTANQQSQFIDVIGDMGAYSAVILSDYNKGMLAGDFCRHLVQLANDANIPVYVDPKGNDWSKYNGAYMVTPNLKEVQELLGRPVANTDNEIEQAGQMILKQFNIEFLLVTRSEKGMSLISRNRAKHFPTRAREVFDVSGAGDTVIATLAWAMVQGQSLDESIHVANVAAGIVVSKLGTTPIGYGELQRALHASDDKVLPLDLLLLELDAYRSQGKKIIFTNGCFDILHRGHVHYLKEARALGDVLIVGLNSDESVRRLKGPTRPVNQELDRAEVMAALESIDHVVIFNEDTPYELLSAIRPDILVKGGDYVVTDVVGREFAKEVVLIPFVNGFSTTHTIKKMNERGT